MIYMIDHLIGIGVLESSSSRHVLAVVAAMGMDRNVLSRDDKE